MIRRFEAGQLQSLHIIENERGPTVWLFGVNFDVAQCEAIHVLREDSESRKLAKHVRFRIFGRNVCNVQIACVTSTHDCYVKSIDGDILDVPTLNPGYCTREGGAPCNDIPDRYVAYRAGC